MNSFSLQPNIQLSGSSTLVQTIPSWEIYLQDQKKSRFTVKSFLGDMQLFAGYFPSDKTIGGISTGDINNFLNWLQNERRIPCSPKSFARRITTIKSFFRWLSKNGRILVDPAEAVLQHSVISPLPIVLNQQEHEMILNKAIEHRNNPKPDTRYFALYRLLIATGIKKSECLALHQNHIDLETTRGPYLFVRYSQPGNRYKERKIDLPEDWIEGYKEYLEQYHPVDLVFPWSPRRLEYLLEELCQETQLTKHLSFDMCRWTCALMDWNANMETDAIRQKMGVSKIQWREVSLKLRQLANPNANVSENLG
jgi:site-specific recombinase XerD